MYNHNLTRFGCHRFLNSRLFSDYLLEHRHDLHLDIRFDHPAGLADALKAGNLDIAFIPSIEYPNIPKGRIVPDISISSIGVVKTVLLICAKKLDKVQSIAVDDRSRTSVVLLKIILENWGIRHCAFSPMPPDINFMLDRSDGALVIGDAAFGADGSGLYTYDLSSEWFRLTKKPFVHAIIVAAAGSRIKPDLLEGLERAKSVCQERMGRIVHEESAKLHITVEECEDYLMNKIIYNLGPGEIDGLKKFYEMAAEYGFINFKSPILHFLDVK